MRVLNEQGRVISLALQGEDTGQTADIDSYGFSTGRLLAEDGTTVNLADIFGGEDTGLTADIEEYAPRSGRVIAEDGRVVNIAKSLSAGVPQIAEEDWNALTTEEKQSHGIVAIVKSSSGYNRGILVNGEDYQPWDTVESTLPLTITTNGEPTINYKIYGNTVDKKGVGVETESGEPKGYKLPMVCRSQTQNTVTPIYIGTCKLMRGEYISYSDRKIIRLMKKLVLTGEENINTVTVDGHYWYYFEISDTRGRTEIIHGKCSHFTWNEEFTNIYHPLSDMMCGFNANDNSEEYNGSFSMRYDAMNGATAFKQFLSDQYAAGTPVTIWYIPSTSTEPTEPIEEDPPVPLPTLPTYAGSDTVIDYEEELAPSKMEVTYER